MIVAFTIASGCFVAGIAATVHALVKDAYNDGYRAGLKRGTYDACRQQVDTDAFFRCVDTAASKTQFPHRN
jgi:hypothetical protein